MRILMTGATGFVGTPLARALFLAGHELVILSRNASSARRRVGVKGDYVQWNPLSGPPPAMAVAGVDAVFNLMGENLGAGRWTEKRKRAIYDSRVKGTAHLVAGVADANADGIGLWVNFSAIGFYPTNRAESFDEGGPRGEGFASDVCAYWEAAASSDNPAARRVVLRVGTVLGANGGALEKLLPPFKAGAGGPVGAGRQMMSWIHRDDLVALCMRCVDNDSFEGVYNAVAPGPVSNANFSKALGRALGRPAVLPAPPVALKLALGEMAQLVLDGQSIVSARLADAGFRFQYGNVDDALREAAGRLPVGLNGEEHVCDRFEDFTFIDRPVEKVFEFFSDAYNLERMTPDLLRFRILGMSEEPVREGTTIDYSLRLHGLPFKWKTLIREWQAPDRFIDYQLKGPYRIWNHLHRFIPVAGGTAMTDRVDYQLPLGVLGGAAAPLVRRDVQRIFDYRHDTIIELMEAGGAD
ncbi:MAG: TIGR01777 family oxidoreductase [Pseudomonadota bacterium]